MDNNRILLIVPPQENTIFPYVMPSLGIGYLGSSLKVKGYDIRIVDLALVNNDLNKLKEELIRFAPFAIGLTGFTYQYPGVKRIISLAKDVNKKFITIFGGHQATSLSEYVMNDNPGLDFVIRGEGEIVLPELLNRLLGNQDYDDLSGIVYRRDGRVVFNTNPELIKDLDSLVHPWETINPLEYPQERVHGFIVKNKPVAQIISSRGCPYGCTFCGGRVVLGNKIRYRTAEKFVDEMEYLVDKFGIKEIQIVDDNFTFDLVRVKKICNETLDRKLNISWTLPNGIRADRVDRETLELMKTSGCYYMAFGFEFGSKRISELVRKGMDLEKAKETVRVANKLGFITHGFFLMGHYNEKLEELKETEKLMCSLPLDRVSIGIPYPYPGSGFFKYYLEKGVVNLNSFIWEDFLEYNFKPILEHINLNSLFRQIKHSYLKFYFNPFRIFRFISKLDSFLQFQSIYEGFKIWIRHVLYFKR